MSGGVLYLVPNLLGQVPPEAVLPAVMRKPEQLRLQPTMHSPLQ